jgi:exopolysaccharide biosynthesis polyprenyl glycosylphosphotransferase
MTSSTLSPAGTDHPQFARRTAGETGTEPSRPAGCWKRSYQRALVVSDLAMGLLGAALAAALRWSAGPASALAVPEPLAVALVPLVWVGLLFFRGSYERNSIGFGVDEFRKVLNCGAHLLAFIVILAFAAESQLSRLVTFTSVLLVVMLTLAGRYALRRIVHHQRKRGRATHRVLLVGMRESVRDLAAHFERIPEAGYAVAGACIPGPGTRPLVVGQHSVPVLCSPRQLPRTLHHLENIDVLAVTDTTVLPDGELRRLAWGLADLGIDLVVAPAIADLAGPRISVDPVAGLPLLHVDQPYFNRATHLLKRVVEVVIASAALLVVAPLLAVVALLIKLGSPGPVLFKQQRVGLGQRTFTMWKFRTMVPGAAEQQALLADLNEHDGVLFKMRQDPRVTRLGRWLRRFSLDELPQLVHVVTGKMALVGPRPPLPCEVARYDDVVQRRLLVRPGLTGLWQVSGRSDLSWEESVRLDVYYVDNWSIALDIAIVMKTILAVIRARGAY